jgi:exodeoxyribonuclease V alpha subunit
MPGVKEGQSLKLEGEWVTDPKYGPQFRASSVSMDLPATVEGLERYLASGLLPGVGPAIAQRIVARFGEQTLDVMRETPEQLSLITGISDKKAEQIATVWKEKHGLHEMYVALATYNISPGLAGRLWRQYGPNALKVLREDPYRLAEEIAGVGFKTADAIATRMGVDPASPKRLAAGVVHVLKSAGDDGNLYVLEPVLLEKAKALLDQELSALASVLATLEAARKVVLEPLPEGSRAVYTAAAHRTETELAQALLRLMETRREVPEGAEQSAIAEAEASLAIELAPEQRLALRAVLRNKLVVVTGGPGTGKTTVVRSICACLQALGERIALAAPTGRAAKRLAEATGVRASTVHRLLAYSPRTLDFERNAENPIEADAVIVDESSMLDAALALALASAVPTHARLVLVGDVDQLPPVGPGAVLQHIIESERAEVVRLTEIFRQKRQSLIVTNAHRILHGEVPETAPQGVAADFYVLPREDVAAVLETLRKLVTQRLAAAFSLDPVEDVQVLTPMHRGDLGASNLNALLQEWLNPAGVEWVRGSRRIRVSDKVMQIRNNYDKEVFNGDLGRVVDLSADEGWLRVRFDDRELVYEAAELDELELAYAVTVHKSQGSEYPAVLLPLHTQHYVMLQRNLLYTAVTRARRLAIVVGSERALRLAVERNEVVARASRLAMRLRGEAPC